MDGLTSTGLPPIPGAAPPAFVSPGGMPQQPQQLQTQQPRSQGLPGRPANDEEQQQARVMRQAERKRLEAVLP